MTTPDGFTPGDWQTLRFAPLWVFSAIVGSYHGAHPLEYEALWRAVDVARERADGLSRHVLDAVSADRVALRQEYEADDRPLASGLGDVMAVLAAVPAGESRALRDLLVGTIGRGVGLARGMFGQAMSRQDAISLGIVAAFLEVDLGDDDPAELASA